MGQAGERLRSDLDKFAHDIGAKVEKRNGITYVTMPTEQERALRDMLGETSDAENDLLDGLMDEDELFDY